MARSEFFRQLRLRREQLLREIASIDVLLADDPDNNVSDTKETPHPIIEKQDTLKSEGPKPFSKGSNNWDQYVMLIIKVLGTPIRTSQIISFAEMGNQRMDRNKLIDAIRGTVSRLTKETYLIAEKAGSKYEGYTYTINPAKTMEIAA